ncbi:hypothetical protein ACFV0Z_11255 [Streptomyces xiamenensis]|uniref:hypothetical protein n=1 Tax=Streptomyces xiamenensis TaxID=408015 RepID=UPI0036B372EA
MRVPEPTASSRRRRLVRGGSAVLVLSAVAGYGVIQFTSSPGPAQPPHCTVAGEGETASFTMRPQQAANAATIQAVGTARGLPERAITIAIATAMQESSLYNIDYGDRDSVGLFQQRPSQGWGTVEEIMDPVYSAGQFYDHLVEIPDYLTKPLTVAAQEVQRSAFPDEYAKHEPRAALLAAAFTGRSPAALNCTVGEEGVSPFPPVEVGDRIRAEFGDQVPVDGDGELVTVGLAPVENTQRGWELAHWSVAHAAELGIERIELGNRVWEAKRSTEGWREADERSDAALEGAGGARTGDELVLSILPGPPAAEGTPETSGAPGSGAETSETSETE